MGWRHVLFANWPVEPDVVRPHVPDSMTLDVFEGDAWLSVVPFTNVDVRPKWAPENWGVRLPELNLRTYVVREDYPGVYFFSLDARGVLCVIGARLLHRLPYYYAHTGLAIDGNAIRFHSRRHHPGSRPAHFRARYEPRGDAFRADPGSLAEFLAERYRYYTEDQGGALRYAEIDHEPWSLYEADVRIDENTLFRANGFDRPDSEPVYYYSPGVDTIASRSRRH